MYLTLLLLIVPCIHALADNGERNYFTVNPRNSQRVQEGKPVVLKCAVQDSRHIKFSWRLKDRDIRNTTRRYQQGSNLVFERVNRTLDEGTFTCATLNVTSGYKMESQGANLIIQWISDEANVLLHRPKSGPITPNINVTLKCDVDGFPEPEIWWYRNKIRIFQAEKLYKLTEDRLKIRSVTAADNGIWTCEGQNDMGKAESSGSFLLNVPGGDNTARLTDSLFVKTTIALRDSTVFIDCSFENAVAIDWYVGARNGALVTNSTKRDRLTVFGNGTMRIDRVRRTDEGTFLCVGTGADTISQTFTAELSIAKLGRVTSSNLEPEIDLTKPVILAAGENFQVDCLRPYGSPTPSIRWENAAAEVFPLTGSNAIIEGTKLKFDSTAQTDSGNYTCVAENMAGKRYITFELVITVPPVLINPPVDTTVKEGDPVVMSCKYGGTPRPFSRVHWYKEGHLISDHQLLSTKIAVNEGTGVLTILRADAAVAGAYHCAVETKEQATVESAVATLHVQKKLKFSPMPRGRTMELGEVETLKCNAEAETPPVINWVRLPTSANMGHHVTANNGILTFNGVKKSDSGNYTCAAVIGEAEIISATVYVAVGTTPKFTVRPANTSVTEGANTTLNCAASGWPQPTIKWFNGENSEVVNMSRFTVLENNSLSISFVEMSDAARYFCMVGNIKAIVRSEMHLTVTANRNVSSGTPWNNPPTNESIGMMKTIVIAVCSAIAYLALVIGLTVWCSIRLMKRKKTVQLEVDNEAKQNGMNGDVPKETDRLMMPADGASTVSNGNGHVMSSMSPRTAPCSLAVTDSQSVSSPSHFSSAGSSRSTRSEIMKYNRKKLRTIGVLGKGMYGEVVLAKAPGIIIGEEKLVYVKALVSKDEQMQVEFRLEVEMYHKLNHERVCKLLALCKEVEPIYLVMEYCEWGDLKQFLIATSRENGQQLTIAPPDQSQKIHMCLQVAEAMEHIANNRYIHKDLASRNILLQPNLSIKVANLALSRDIYASEYVSARNGPLFPLRWTAPEAWLEDDYSTKSDVWSYGCFVYEMFTGGDIPYPDMTNEAVIEGYESEYFEPPSCDSIPKEMEAIAMLCWSSSPKDRPDFTQILAMISDISLDSGL